MKQNFRACATFAGILTLILRPALVYARLITFPPVTPVLVQGHCHSPQVPLNSFSSPIDVSSKPFHGLTTFANLPYLHCLSASEEIDKYDIALLGAPFDTAVTARPGARYGPTAIRLATGRITPDFAYDVETGSMMLPAPSRIGYSGCGDILNNILICNSTGFNPYKAGFKIVDCGNAPLTFLDNTVALQQLEQSHKIISGRPSNMSNPSTPPRIIVLGGDHTTTLAALRSTYARWGPVSVIHFDSHLDTWRPSAIDGDLSHYAGLNHGTFLHIAHEEGLIKNTSIHAGIRCLASSAHADKRNDERCGFGIIHARAIDRIGISQIAKDIRDRVGSGMVYISVDIDVLDPAYAPATGTPEVGGWSTRELLSILDELEGLKIVGADVVEVAPIYDNPGETTALAAGDIVQTLVKLMVKKPIPIR